MAENENVLENEVQPEPKENKPSKKSKNVGAAVKEWFRKRVVALKRAPHNIPLVATALTTFIYLIWLFTFSRAISTDDAQWTGLALFINTLFSILSLALFLSAFPKRKKANKIIIALIFVFMAVIVVCDVVYYIQMKNYIYGLEDLENHLNSFPFLLQSLNLAIVHIVLVGICAILLATLPLYKKLIMMINTKKVVESNDLTEEIDTSEEDVAI